MHLLLNVHTSLMPVKFHSIVCVYRLCFFRNHQALSILYFTFVSNKFNCSDEVCARKMVMLRDSIIMCCINNNIFSVASFISDRSNAEFLHQAPFKVIQLTFNSENKLLIVLALGFFLIEKFKQITGNEREKKTSRRFTFFKMYIYIML